MLQPRRRLTCSPSTPRRTMCWAWPQVPAAAGAARLDCCTLLLAYLSVPVSATDQLKALPSNVPAYPPVQKRGATLRQRLHHTS